MQYTALPEIRATHCSGCRRTPSHQAFAVCSGIQLSPGAQQCYGEAVRTHHCDPYGSSGGNVRDFPVYTPHVKYTSVSLWCTYNLLFEVTNYRWERRAHLWHLGSSGARRTKCGQPWLVHLASINASHPPLHYGGALCWHWDSAYLSGVLHQGRPLCVVALELLPSQPSRTSPGGPHTPLRPVRVVG